MKELIQCTYSSDSLCFAKLEISKINWFEMTDCCCQLTIWFSFSSPGRKLIFNNYIRVLRLNDDFSPLYSYMAKMKRLSKFDLKSKFPLSEKFLLWFSSYKKSGGKYKAIWIDFLNSITWKEEMEKITTNFTTFLV